MATVGEAVTLSSSADKAFDSTDFQDLSPSSSVTMSPSPSAQLPTKDITETDVGNSPTDDCSIDPSSSTASLDIKGGVESTTAVTSKKKRKKRKGLASLLASSEGSQSPSTSTDDSVELWKQRVLSLRNELSRTQKQSELLKTDLSAAMARARDAEEAESTVNKGLLTARAIISQRDRATAELNANLSTLRAEVAQLTDEKRKTDKRLQLLKTVSANLQEAREARDNFERKWMDVTAAHSALGKQVVQLNEQVDAMGMVKQKLARTEGDLELLTHEMEAAEVKAQQAVVYAACAGAVTAFVCGFILRALSGRRKDE